ncbi:TonB-dependent receptor [Mesoterricola silvestris]|uniref:Membrane protein n=1 Tax=Mesoterricola silvestris TaxID=2927979 RepID=A0AA48GPX0_9BACT|nr:TonB-dependent receptor [Mesoterricola silvestris]BDU71822.1 membrane protein [Mesoterricola silvestris]
MRRHCSFAQLTSVALVLATGSFAWSQQATGQLTGEVRDQAGAPVPRARIILSSPALFSPRTLQVSPKGEWRAVGLPPGTYRIQALADGFVGSEARDVRLGLGASVSQNLQLKAVAAATATVEVIEGQQELDKNDTKTYVNFSADKLEAVSVDRGFAGAANLTPGVNLGANGYFAVRGGTTMDTAFRINGTDIQDDYQGSVVGKYYIEDNIEDVQVMLSPLNARFGRNTGGAVNAVTKSGSNTFAGSLRATVSKASWNASNPFTSANHTQEGPTNREYQFTVSGPIIRDRLWFSLGTIATPASTESASWSAVTPTPVLQRTLNANIDGVLAAGPSALGSASGYAPQMFPGIHFYNQQTKESYYDGKLTGQIFDNHTLEVSYVRRTLDISNRGAWWSDVPILRRANATTQKDKNSALNVNYRGILSSSTFLEAGFNQKLWSMTPPQGDPAYGNQGALYVYGDAPTGFKQYNFLGAPFTYGTAPREERNNKHVWANLNAFLDAGTSKHELDLGFEYYNTSHVEGTQFGADNVIARVGGTYQQAGTENYLFPTLIWTGTNRFGQSPNGRIGIAPTLRTYTGKDGTSKNDSYSAYLNDNWTINAHWQVMGGIRVDAQRVYDIDGARLASATEISPRFQVRFDLGGDNKRLVTLTAARFGGDFTTAFTSAFVKSARSAYTGFGWSGIGNQALPGTSGDLVNGAQAYGVRFVDFAQIMNPANYTGNNGATAFEAWDSSKVYKLADNLKPSHMDEITLGYRRNFDNGDFARVTAVYRQWKQIWAFSTDYAADTMVAIEDPSGRLATQYTPRIDVFNSSDLYRRYTDLEFEFKQTLSRVWSLTGSYTYGRLVGNAEDGQSSSSSFRDTSTTAYYSQRRALTAMGVPESQFAPSGRLMNDQSNRGRLVLLATYPVGKGTVTASWVLQYDAGTTWSATNQAPLAGLMPTPAHTVAAPTIYTKYWDGRGAYTNNDYYSCNFKLGWSFPLGAGLPVVFGSVSVQNLFNHILQTGYDSGSIWYYSNGTNALYVDNANFGQANPAVSNFWNDGRSYIGTLGLRF